jgi:peptidylprolyl isomerase
MFLTTLEQVLNVTTTSIYTANNVILRAVITGDTGTFFGNLLPLLLVFFALVLLMPAIFFLLQKGKGLSLVGGRSRNRAGGHPRQLQANSFAVGVTGVLVAWFLLTWFINGSSSVPAPKSTSVVPAPKSTSVCAEQKNLNQIKDDSPAPTEGQIDGIQRFYEQAPPMSIDVKKKYCAGINTNRGLIVVELKPAWAPQAVNNFFFLARNRFYDGLTFHHVNTAEHPQFKPSTIRGGDPQGDGSGGPGYTINIDKELPPKSDYLAGTMAMISAKGMPANSVGSQFFINSEDNKDLPKKYTVFGNVIQGMDVVKKIQGSSDNPSTGSTPPGVMLHVKVVEIR